MNTKRRVLFNTWSAAFFQKGGGEYQLLHSKAALEKLGFDIELYNQWHPQKNIDILHQFSIEPGVEKVIQQYRSLGVMIVTSTIMWNLVPQDHPEFLRIKNIFNLSDYLLTNSDIESQRLSDAFQIPAEKFIKTRNSITEEYLKDGSVRLFRDKYQIKGDFILSVANIDTRKNTSQLVSACKKLGIPLYTIGHIKDDNYFKSFNNTYSKYTHLGAIEDIELLKSAYGACSVFAMPSMCETPSIAALEAASQGAKIVLTSEGSTKEYFKDYISYCTPRSESELIEAIGHELKKAQKDDLKNYIRSNFTWKKTAQDITNIYNQLWDK